MARRAASILAANVAAMVLVAACGGNDGDARTPTAAGVGTITVIATADTTATPAPDIRRIDLRDVPDVRQLLSAAGGQLVQSSVLYADLTEDGVDEAVVPISSGGTLGDIAFLVLTPDGAAARTLLREQPGGGLSLNVEDGGLVMTQPAPGPDDPECCPSMLKVTTYAWDGAALTVASTETVPNPSGGAAKATATVTSAGQPPPAR